MKRTALKEEEDMERRPSGYLGSEWVAEDLISRHEAKFDESVGLFFGFSTLVTVVISCGFYLLFYLVSPRLGQFLAFLIVRTGKSLFPAFFIKGRARQGNYNAPCSAGGKSGRAFWCQP
ncbi:MAG: hypothetical protein IMF07_06290 [Proteobacteria bacterium]|nr:hypothetical protein [Pseudomonadota bacterium]